MMRRCRLVPSLLILLCLGTFDSALCAQTPKPLTEAELVKRVGLLTDEEIAQEVAKRGIDFAPDEAAVARLKQAGFKDVALTAVAKAVRPMPAGGSAVTYEKVLALLQAGIEEEIILQRLEKSPTRFTLGADQLAALKQAGASDKLLDLLQGKGPAGTLGDVTDVVIILDCSGSMKDKTPEGPSKMQAAKRVVNDLILKIPDGRRLGLIVYGHTLKDKCAAVQVVKPLTPLDEAVKKELMAAVINLEAVGHTPIARALQVAGTELVAAKGVSGLILITDGMETCHGDPAAEAAALIAANPGLTFGIHVIGFGIDPKEKTAVEGIAKAGKGTFYDAQSAKKLEDAIGGLRERIIDRRAAPAPPPPGNPGEPSPRVKVLIKALTDSDPMTRQMAALELGKLGREARPAVPALVKRVGDETWVNRSPFVTARSTADPGNAGKGAALAALKELAPDKVSEALIPGLRSSFPQQRIWAADELRKNKDKGEETVKALIERIADDTWIEKGPFVSKDPYDPKGGGKEAALNALKALAPARVADALAKAAESRNGNVKRWALQLQLGSE